MEKGKKKREKTDSSFSAVPFVKVVHSRLTGMEFTLRTR